MKHSLFLLMLMCVFSLLQAQDYQITFSGSGESTTVDSVQVMNITQDTSLTVNGSDILHLQGTVGINTFTETDNSLHIYPNPMGEQSKIAFYNEKSTAINLDLFDLSGRLIIGLNHQVQKGISLFEISGLVPGAYSLIVSTSEWKRSAKLVATNSIAGTPQIAYVESIQKPGSQNTLKSTSDIVLMQYNNGDLILFVAYSSGSYARVITLVPIESLNVDFFFVECTDGDGGFYPIVKIGTQDWMAKSLSTTKLSDGTAIPNVTDDFDWSGLETPAYCYYENDGSGYGNTYGVLYNWYAVETENLCPEGWRVPSDADWTVLSDYLGGEDIAGGKLKETTYNHWLAPNAYATNEYGFTALPGGYRIYNGAFDFVESSGFWWSSTVESSGTVLGRYMSYVASNLYTYSYNRRMGLSVRCIKD